MLYWAPGGTIGGSGMWDPGSSDDYWLTSGDSLTTWSSGAVAIFAGSGGPWTVTVQSAPDFKEMVFVGGSYVLAGQPTSSSGSLAVLGGSVTLSEADAFTVVDVAGGTLDCGGNTIGVTGPMTLADGAIQDGTVSAASYFVENGGISAVLAGSGALTVDGGARGHGYP